MLVLDLARGSPPAVQCPAGHGGQASGAGRHCWGCWANALCWALPQARRCWLGHPSSITAEVTASSCPVYPIPSILSCLVPSHPIPSHVIPSPFLSCLTASHPIPSVLFLPMPCHAIPSLLFYSVPSHPLFYSVSSHPILFHPLCFISSHAIPSVLSCPILSCPNGPLP